jgi:antirestriction protein ArdC
MKTDIYAEITNAVITCMDKGDGTYVCPWHTGIANQSPRNCVTQRHYRGINVLSLWVAAMKAGYDHALWATYKQWQSAGGQVREGAKGSVIVFYKPFEIVGREDQHGDAKKVIPLVRYRTVFNIAQVDGVERPVAQPKRQLFDRSPAIDALVDRLAVPVEHSDDGRAYYEPSRDRILMPHEQSFIGTPTSTAYESYYSVLFHELGHATGAEHRLKRRLVCNSGDPAYAFEEIIAELTAAFCCARLGVASSPRADHACYIASYIALMKADHRAVFKAATAAAAACDFIIGPVETAREETA